MPGIEEEEEEVGVRPLKLHRGHLTSDSIGSQIFVWNLQIMIGYATKLICSFMTPLGYLQRLLLFVNVGSLREQELGPGGKAMFG